MRRTDELAQDAQPQNGPFCSRYVQYLRLRQAAGPVRLVNAREGGPLVEELQRAGLDLDQGMVLKLGGLYYHGAHCIHALALLSSGSGLFNRINAERDRVERALNHAGGSLPPSADVRMQPCIRAEADSARSR